MSRSYRRTVPDRYSYGSTDYENSNNMDIRPASFESPAANDNDFDALSAGWDPYIFAILAGMDRTHAKERRRMPRPLTTVRRRALLLASMIRR